MAVGRRMDAVGARALVTWQYESVARSESELGMEKPFEVVFPAGERAQAVRIRTNGALPEGLKALGLGEARPAIVVVGGAGGMSEAELQRSRPILADVLSPLAEAEGAVVLDGGTDSGVMRLMGEVRVAKAGTYPLLGVVAEGTVHLPRTRPGPDTAGLDANHTQFALIPGSVWGDDSLWMARAADWLARRHASVTVLINGGEIAKEDVALSLASQRPVVVMAGTGRYADELAATRDRPPLVYVADVKAGLANVSEVVAALLRGGRDGEV